MHEILACQSQSMNGMMKQTAEDWSHQSAVLELCKQLNFFPVFQYVEVQKIRSLNCLRDSLAALMSSMSVVCRRTVHLSELSACWILRVLK